MRRSVLGLGAERERKQRDHDQREQHRIERVAAAAPDQREVARASSGDVRMAAGSASVPAGFMPMPARARSDAADAPRRAARCTRTRRAR